MSAFIEEHRARFGVEPICQTLGVSASAYYQRATGQRSARAVEDERLLALINELHAANYHAYGSRRMWKALLREGERVGRSRVERLMRQNGIQGAKRRGKPWRTTKADPAALRSPDRVQRDFTASRPDEKWFADFTYLRCWEGLVFFSFVIDAYSRMVVGWQFANHMRTGLVLDDFRREVPGVGIDHPLHALDVFGIPVQGSRAVLPLEAAGQRRTRSADSARPLTGSGRHHSGGAQVGGPSFIHIPVLAPNARHEQGRSAPVRAHRRQFGARADEMCAPKMSSGRPDHGFHQSAMSHGTRPWPSHFSTWPSPGPSSRCA